jgi:hypothetical protein
MAIAADTSRPRSGSTPLSLVRSRWPSEADRHFGHRGGRHRFDDGWGRAHGGHRRRIADSGELRLVLLALIEREPRHGYDLSRAIENLTVGNSTHSQAPSAATMLHRCAARRKTCAPPLPSAWGAKGCRPRH